AHNNLGIVKALRGASAEALVHFQTAVRLAPQFTDARNNLGLALSRAGRSEAAIREFQSLLSLRPGNLDATHHLARELLALGAAGEAATALAQVLERGTAETRSLLALSLQSLTPDQLESRRAHVLRALAEGWARGGELERVGIVLAKRSAGLA